METALTAGAPPGFDEFYGAELDRQVRRAYLLTGSNETANDIVHDAMIEVWRRWDRLDSPAGYLTITVVNRCRDAARRRSVRTRSAHLVAVRDVAHDGDLATTLRIGEALRTLPFEQPAAIVLRFYADMSTADIAAALHCRPGSVGSRINRGLARLRKELDR